MSARRNWIRIVLASAFGVVAAATCQGERQRPNRPPSEPTATVAANLGEGTPTMHQLELTISTTRAEVLPDESFDIDVSITNRDSTAVEVPSPDATTVFKFVLRAADDGRVVQIWDAEQAFEAHTGDPMEPEEPETEHLDPGQTMEYRYDLAKFYVASLLPGSYALSFIYRSGTDSWESPGAPLTIVRPNITRFAAIHGPAEENLSIVFTNAGSDGSVTLCQRESYFHRPDCGILCRRITHTPTQTVTEVATAIELYYNRGIRWFAWLEGNALGAGVAQYRTLFGQFTPLPLGLESAELHTLGWQLDEERAVFAILGIDSIGQLALALETFPSDEGHEVRPIPLTSTRMPARWVVQCRVEGEKRERATFDLVMADSVDGSVRLTRYSIDPDAGMAQSGVILHERKAPLVCLAADPVAEEPATGVDALFGPVGDDAHLTFVRLPLERGGISSEWTIPAPVDPSGPNVASDWAIPARPIPVPIVAVKLGDRLLVRDVAENAEWRLLAADAAQAKQLRIEVIGSAALWAVWIDPNLGIQYRMIRE